MRIVLKEHLVYNSKIGRSFILDSMLTSKSSQSTFIPNLNFELIVL